MSLTGLRCSCWGLRGTLPAANRSGSYLPKHRSGTGFSELELATGVIFCDGAELYFSQPGRSGDSDRKIRLSCERLCRMLHFSPESLHHEHFGRTFLRILRAFLRHPLSTYESRWPRAPCRCVDAPRDLFHSKHSIQFAGSRSQVVFHMHWVGAHCSSWGCDCARSCTYPAQSCVSPCT